MDVTSLHHRRATARWERVSVGDIFERLTWSYPDKEAIVAWSGTFADPAFQRVTYRQADEIANRIADTLLARGLERGDRVLLFCENSVEAYLTKFGIAKAGLTCVPVNPMLAPDVVAYLIDRVEPAFSIVDAELWPKASEAFALRGLTPDVTIEIGGGRSTGPSASPRGSPTPPPPSRTSRSTPTTSGRSSSPRARPRCRRARWSRTTTATSGPTPSPSR